MLIFGVIRSMQNVTHHVPPLCLHLPKTKLFCYQQLEHHQMVQLFQFEFRKERSSKRRYVLSSLVRLFAFLHGFDQFSTQHRRVCTPLGGYVLYFAVNLCCNSDYRYNCAVLSGKTLLLGEYLGFRSYVAEISVVLRNG